MRSLFRRAMIVGTTFAATAVGSGCQANKATEYVAGISTQVSVPRDLKAIRIDVSVGGFTTFCGGYRVYDGKVLLPRSLGAFATSKAAQTTGPVQYSIMGVTDADTASALFTDCGTQLQVGKDNVRVLRRSRQPYIPDEIRFIPMPLKYSCFDTQCADEETCKGGKCVPATLSLEQAKAAFPLYAPDLVDGTNGNCFNATMCLGLAAPAVIVDPDTCTYAVANSASAPPPVSPLVDPFRQPCDTAADCINKSACTIIDSSIVAPDKPGRCDALPPNTPWAGTNVEVVYDGGKNREVLDLDQDEGFSFSDPAKPQQFRLAPGLCEMVKGVDDKGNPTKHRITAIRARGTCQPKRLPQPICADDQNAEMGVDKGGLAVNPNPPNDCTAVQLKPPHAALMVLVDNTQDHQAFFDAQQLAAVELPLRDPAFAQTDIGLQFTPGAAACTATMPPDVPLELAADVRQTIIDKLLAYATNPSLLVAGTPKLEGALSSAYKTLASLSNDTYFKRAVIVLENRNFATDECNTLPGTAIDDATNALASTSDPTKSISTYVIQLAKAPDQPSVDSPMDPEANHLNQVGSTNPPSTADARGTKKNAKDAFQRIINTLATCVYDVDDANAPEADDTISYSNPVTGITTKIPANGACTGENVAGEGWGFGTAVGKRRIFLCNNSCTDYQNVLAQASDYALLYGQPPLAVPIFAHKASCEPK
jgi:hypothetical protein